MVQLSRAVTQQSCTRVKILVTSEREAVLPITGSDLHFRKGSSLVSSHLLGYFIRERFTLTVHAPIKEMRYEVNTVPSSS